MNIRFVKDAARLIASHYDLAEEDGQVVSALLSTKEKEIVFTIHKYGETHEIKRELKHFGMIETAEIAYYEK